MSELIFTEYSRTQTIPILNTVVSVDGVIYPRTSAGINAAIADTRNAGTLFLTSGNYTIDATINIVQPINIMGAGRSTYLIVSAGLGATTDIFSINPTDDGESFHISDFTVACASGTPGRHLFHLNGATSLIQQVFIERIIAAKLGGNFLYAEGSGLSNGTPAISTIRNNVFWGGIVFENCGDLVRIQDNLISGAGPALDIVSWQQGASTLIVEGNSISSDGGIHIGGKATFSHFIRNEIETFASFTGSNGAVLDIDGTSANPAEGVVISGNSFQVVAGIAANSIRVNYANRTNIQNNNFSRGISPSKDIQITINALETFIGPNQWYGGGPLTSMISDSGRKTVYAFSWNGSFIYSTMDSIDASDSNAANWNDTGSATV